jgi:ribosome biogenesis GTPase A
MKNNDLMPSIRAKSYIKKQMEEVLTVGLPKGLYTGEQNLDDLVRLDLGMFAVVTGYANVGKSELIDWLCVSYNLNYKYTTLFYSPENSIQ